MKGILGFIKEMLLPLAKHPGQCCQDPPCKIFSNLQCNDLAIIPSHLCITCRIGNILFACNKEFAFTANYAKRHWSMFHNWMDTYLPGSMFLSVVCVLYGYRQDTSFKGPFPLYIGQSHMVALLDKLLHAG
jgi:hypothetical protein